MSAIVCFSGGVDSTVLVEKLHLEGRLAGTIFFDYNQPAAHQEQLAVTRWRQAHGRAYPHRNMRLDIFLGNMSSTCVGACEVPGRNLLFAVAAANWAVVMGADKVLLGPNADDAIYTDCTPESLRTIDTSVYMNTGVHIEYPLIQMKKTQIITLAREYRLDVKGMWSCYFPVGNKPCGICSSCQQNPQ